MRTLSAMTAILIGLAIACGPGPSSTDAGGDAADMMAAEGSSFVCGAISCGAGQLCVHFCDCCGLDGGDGGPPPSGHDECLTDTGQCTSPSQSFYLGGRWCGCYGRTNEADCPCA